MRTFTIATLLVAFAALGSSASPLEKRVNAPAPCQQAGTGKFGVFSVTPTSNVKRGQALTVHYQQSCADKGNVHPTQLSVTINAGGNSPLQRVVTHKIAAADASKPITIKTHVPDGALQYGDGSDLTIVGTVAYTQKGVPGVTYLFQHAQAFSIDESS